jgi:serine phosphatase RsbU (regulator of sigma subunit)/CheY-like chemotaxis protein
MDKPQIMVVEDEGLVALEIKEGLENMGYEVPYVLSSGKEAIERVMIDRPDLVLMDIRLEGGVDGIEAAEQIRKIFNVPVVFLTAHSDEKTLQRAKLTESYGYILKPFEERALRATIEVALYKAKEEKKVRINRDWLSIILRSLAEGVIVIDTKGEIRFINAYAESILKWELAEAMGKHLNEVFKTVDMDKHQPQEIPFLKAIVDGLLINKKNVILLSKDQDEEVINYTIAPLKNDTGITIGTVIIFKGKETQNLGQEPPDHNLGMPFKIQQNLLPAKEKTISGVHMDWLFYPSVFGSGDLIDFFSLDENHLGFYILDVIGHGFSATLFAFSLHKYLCPDTQRGGILKRGNESTGNNTFRRKDDLHPDLLNPAEVISLLNKQFYFEANSNPFFTLIYGIINTRTQQLRLARAGQPFPLLQRKNADLFSVESEGYAIGLASDIELNEAALEFKKGDRLYLFSDGLLEIKNNQGKKYSRNKLVQFLEEHKNTTVSEMLAELENELTGWKGGTDFADDVVFMVIENM